MAVSTSLNTSIFMSSKKYKHLKTGNIYEVIRDDVLNCTNANDEQIMVLYKNEQSPELLFVREKNEFLQKFELIK